jgi:hypothetical protein
MPLITKDFFTNCICSIIIGIIASCENGQHSNFSDTVQSEEARPIETTKNGLLNGVWHVQKLDIPYCDGLNEHQIKLDQLWNDEVELEDSFIFQNDSMFLRSKSIKKLEESYKFKDSLLTLEGSDWVYDKMTIRKFTPDSLSLAVLQRNICPTDDGQPRYLIITLVRFHK